jgi:hypothetical protein
LFSFTSSRAPNAGRDWVVRGCIRQIITDVDAFRCRAPRFNADLFVRSRRRHASKRRFAKVINWGPSERRSGCIRQKALHGRNRTSEQVHPARLNLLGKTLGRRHAPKHSGTDAIADASAGRPFRQQQRVPKPCRPIVHEGRRYRSWNAAEDRSKASTWRARRSSRPNSRC